MTRASVMKRLTVAVGPGSGRRGRFRVRLGVDGSRRVVARLKLGTLEVRTRAELDPEVGPIEALVRAVWQIALVRLHHFDVLLPQHRTPH